MPDNSDLAYFLTVVAAMALKIVPLPHALEYVNPDWVLLVLVYWSLALPERFGVFNAWVVGLLVDVLTGRLLGQSALIYSLACYLCVKLHKRIRHYPIPQQSLFVFVCLLIGQLIVFWIENMQGINRLPLGFWIPVLSGTVMWPAIYLLLRFVRSLGRSV